jgi:peptidoglycan L-alanyl-D-glutamate endopeptidase CwlK
MASFGVRSKTRLQEAHPDLQRLFERVVQNFDCAVIEGHRDEEKQNALFNSGQSKVQWPNSKHNSTPSMAVDVCPYPCDWDDAQEFYFFSGYVLGIAKEMGIKIRWGGDWDQDLDINDQNFNDLVHFELVED